MSTLDVAKKDFLDVRRAKIVWFVGALYVLFMAMLVYFGQNGSQEPNILNALWNLTAVGAMFIPLIALVTAYLAIAGERESGSIKYMLSIPNTRRDVVLGKFLTRTSVVAVSIVVAFLLGGGLTLAWYPDPEMDAFAIMTALTVVYALTYVAVAIGISAATDSRSRAMGGSIAFFFVTSVLNVFGPLQFAIDYVANDLAGLEISMYQIAFVQSLVSPTAAYVNSTALAFPEGFNTIPPDLPWFLQGETMLVVLVGWLVVPLALGIWQFERADLS
ncbi:ABC transporter permease [Haloterrigena alkaliphila]|uniref:ABC transporter permease n=1 Tax=Haloterrigena alkaliphila TaxID=2816475 RepID=A0A8A2VI65_9EURY|nr:ABC transporter permease subunit [Haloterrigena alkaliphila]QSX00023.1 ABC transporter permease [Haloterrigena alkaliphila]